MDNNENETKRLKSLLKKIEGVFEKIPSVIGIEAVKLYKENFAKQGWQGTNFEPWQRKKKENGYNILRTNNQNSLMDSIHVADETPNSVTIATGDNKPYAQIHNEGGTITIPITNKMRKRAWAMFYETGNVQYKAMVNGNRHMYHIFFRIEDFHYLVNVFVFQHIGVGCFLEKIFPACIYKLRFVFGFMF
jgi:phage gpG-like protein